MSNDPHLANQIPSTWYLNELNIKGEYFTGASLPGIPMIAIGRSRDISWGITNSKADVSDWYYEKIDGDKYFHDGQWKPMTPRKETIKIRGQPDLEYNIWHTHHGPVFQGINPYALNRVSQLYMPASYDNLAFQWTGHMEEENCFTKMLNIKNVKNMDQFMENFYDYTGPSYALVAADSSGNIGYIQPGLFPIREDSRYGGQWVKLGHLPENDWKGWVPRDQIPKLVNPSKGYIVTANNRATTDNVSYNSGMSMAGTARANRITEMIEEAIKNNRTISPFTSLTIQAD